ncbi:hypothetical protein ACOSQ3_004053 [Xanthoceras sorbifolium]
MHLAVYSDANWASCVDDSKSTSGCCVFLGGNLINWSSKKQTVVARSSTEAEYRALAQAGVEVLWVQSLFSELGLTVPSCAIIWYDNTSAASLAHNAVFHARTKHIEIDVHFIREKIASKQLTVQCVPTELQKADIFTKALPQLRFEFLRSKLNLLHSPRFSLRGYVKDSMATSSVQHQPKNASTLAVSIVQSADQACPLSAEYRWQYRQNYASMQPCNSLLVCQNKILQEMDDHANDQRFTAG